jgi:hypothetical protein
MKTCSFFSLYEIYTIFPLKTDREAYDELNPFLQRVLRSRIILMRLGLREGKFMRLRLQLLSFGFYNSKFND